MNVNFRLNKKNSKPLGWADVAIADVTIFNIRLYEQQGVGYVMLLPEAKSRTRVALRIDNKQLYEEMREAIVEAYEIQRRT